MYNQFLTRVLLRSMIYRYLTLSAVFLFVLGASGCAAVALTAAAVGGGVAANHQLGGIAYRTFTAPLPRVRSAAMGGMLHSVLDVTVAYSESSPTLWDLCCGRLGPVRMHVLRRPIEPWVAQGDYAADSRLRARFKEWLGALWTEKDARIARAVSMAWGDCIHR